MTATLIKQPIIWVENDEELNQWCDKWQEKKVLAVDTEFMRSQTYFPIAALIQVNDGQNNVLIDPTQISDFSYFAELMVSTSIVKAIHSCSEDLEVFYRVFGVAPQCLFDTQMAASALGYGFSVGYANLVNAVMGIELPKAETRSDWLQRPLSQAQIQYAAIDVEYLFELAKRFLVDLTSQNRLFWIQEECDSLLKNHAEMQLPENAHQRFKSAWKLDERQLASLIALSTWREQKAQERDIPRNRVIKENALFQIALKQPKTINQLRKFEGVSERMIRADGNHLINIIKTSQDIAQEELPARLPNPPGAVENRIIKLLREKVSFLAESLNVAPELLVKKKDYEFIVKNPQQLSVGLDGWRKQVVGEQLLQWYQAIYSSETAREQEESRENNC